MVKFYILFNWNVKQFNWNLSQEFFTFENSIFLIFLQIAKSNDKECPYMNSQTNFSFILSWDFFLYISIAMGNFIICIFFYFIFSKETYARIFEIKIITRLKKIHPSNWLLPHIICHKASSVWRNKFSTSHQ